MKPSRKLTQKQAAELVGKLDLKKLRTARGWTQAEAGAAIRVSKQHWAQLERGEKRLTPAMYLLIQFVFRLPRQ